jgi:hypothetical protein
MVGIGLDGSLQKLPVRGISGTTLAIRSGGGRPGQEVRRHDTRRHPEKPAKDMSHPFSCQEERAVGVYVPSGR